MGHKEICGYKNWARLSVGDEAQHRPQGGHTGHSALLTDLPVPVHQIGLFISYDNATKQLDTVYDITPRLAQAFLERIGSSAFDMRNTSTIHRQGPTYHPSGRSL